MKPIELLQRLPRPRRRGAEWLVLAGVLLMSALMAGYFIWSERRLLIASDIERMRMQTLIIDENLQHQFEGVRNALDSARRAFHPGSGCTAECRRVLLQSLKRASMTASTRARWPACVRPTLCTCRSHMKIRRAQAMILAMPVAMGRLAGRTMQLRLRRLSDQGDGGILRRATA